MAHHALWKEKDAGSAFVSYCDKIALRTELQGRHTLRVGLTTNHLIIAARYVH